MCVKTSNRKEVHWHINYFCNYSCSYCFLGKGQQSGFRGTKNIEATIDGFDKTGLTWLINITGGEPFFSPHFIELCQGLCRKHTISLNTNLSHPDVFRFAERINPARVGYIHCGLHIQECEERGLIKDFVKKFRLLRDKGFYIYVSYVMFPSVLKRFEEDYGRFKEEGIILRPKVFRGTVPRLKISSGLFPGPISGFFQREYPSSYSRQERRKILSFMDRSQQDGRFLPLFGKGLPDRGLVDVGLDKNFVGNSVSCLGDFCNTGFQCVRMSPEGDVFRCHGNSHSFGNLFEGSLRLFDRPSRCPDDICLCPYMGLKHTGRYKKNRI
jgi:MoaA/NifB/PqqE/SkfB family radical SAM enzyme